MKFGDFIKKGMAKRKKTDRNLARVLKKTAEIDLKFFERINIDDVSARKVVSGYYDILREILEGLAAIKGYKIYSHETFTYFLKKNGEDIRAEKFDRFRLIRNRINYYGKSVSCEEAKEYSEEIKKMIDYFLRKLNDEIEKN